MSQNIEIQKNKVSKTFLKKLSTILKRHVREIKKKDKLLKKKIKESNKLYNKSLLQFKTLFKSLNSDRTLNKIYNIKNNKKTRKNKNINHDISNIINIEDVNNDINKINDFVEEIKKIDVNNTNDLIPNEKLDYSIKEDDILDISYNFYESYKLINNIDINNKNNEEVNNIKVNILKINKDNRYIFKDNYNNDQLTFYKYKMSLFAGDYIKIINKYDNYYMISCDFGCFLINNNDLYKCLNNIENINNNIENINNDILEDLNNNIVDINNNIENIDNDYCKCINKKECIKDDNKLFCLGCSKNINEEEYNNNNNDEIIEVKDLSKLLYPHVYYNKNDLINDFNNKTNDKYYIFSLNCKKFFATDDLTLLNKDLNINEIVDNTLYKDERFYKLFFDIETTDEKITCLTKKQQYKYIDMFINVLYHFITDNYKEIFNINDDLDNNDLYKILYDDLIILQSQKHDIKMSYHIIFNNITFKDMSILKNKFINNLLKYDKYISLLKDLENKDIFISLPDCAIYSAFRNFRCLNQSKKDKNNNLYIYNHNNKDISNINIIDTLILKNNKGLLHNNEIYENNILVDNNIINDVYKSFEHEEFKNIIYECLMSLPSYRYEENKEWGIIMKILRAYDIEYYNMFVEFSKQSKKKFNKKVCFNNWYYYYKYDDRTPPINSIMNMLKKDDINKYNEIIKKYNYNDNNIDAYASYLINDFYNLDLSNNLININILNINDLSNNIYLPQNIFINNEYDTLLCSSCLGSGKSSRFSEMIKYYTDLNKSVIVLTPRILYAYSIQSGFKEDINIDFTLYKDKKGIISDDYLICQMESLTRVLKYKYDVVILDEIFGIIQRLSPSAEKCHINLYDTFRNFEKLIKNADIVIGADAFINNTCINVIRSLRQNKKISLIYNPAQPYNRKAIKINNEDNFKYMLMKKLKDENKKIIMFDSSKEDIINIVDAVKKSCPDKKILCHYADSHTALEEKELFKNVVNTWSNYDLVAFSSKLTVGINFNIDYFDCQFIRADKRIIINDVFQASFRSRKLKDEELYYYVVNGQSKNIYHISNDIIKNDLENNKNSILQYSPKTTFNNIPEWYNNLLIDIIKQEKINSYYYENSFNHFLNITGYKQEEYNNIESNNELKTLLQTIKEDRKEFKQYHNILNIKNMLYSIEILKKDSLFIDHINNFIKNYRLHNNINDDNNDLDYYLNNIIPSYYIDKYIRYKITKEQKDNNNNDESLKLIKRLIDMNNIIKNINIKEDEDKTKLLDNLFNLYNDKYNNHVFKNIRVFESYTPQEYQEIYNNNFKLGHNIELIKNVGKSLDICKEVSKILNIKNPYTNHYNISNDNINNAYKYIMDNKKDFDLIFNDRFIKKDPKKIYYIKLLFKTFYNSNVSLMEKYNGRTEEKDKKYKITNDLFNVVELKNFDNKKIIYSNLLDAGNDLFDDNE